MRTRSGLLLDAGRAGFVHPGPIRADHRQQKIVLQDSVLDVLAEIRPERDIVDVHEDGMLAVVTLQPIADASGDRVGIGPAVGNDDLRHRLQMLMHQGLP